MARESRSCKPGLTTGRKVTRVYLVSSERRGGLRPSGRAEGRASEGTGRSQAVRGRDGSCAAHVLGTLDDAANRIVEPSSTALRLVALGREGRGDVSPSQTLST